MIEAGDIESLRYRVAEKQIVDAKAQAGNIVGLAASQGLDAEGVVDQYRKQQVRTDVAVNGGHTAAYLGDVLGDYDITASEALVVSRAAQLRQMAEERLARRDDDGFLSSTGQLGEWFGWAMTLGWAESVLGVHEDNVEKYQELFLIQDTQEFTKRVTELLDEAEEAGWFTEDNWMFLQDKIFEMEEMGFSPTTKASRVLDTLFAGFEGLNLATKVVPAITKGGRALTNVTTGATGAAASTVTPTVAAQAASAQSTVFSDLMKINHGSLVPREAVEQRATEMATELAKSNSVSYIGHSLKVDELQNYVVKVQVGKPTGDKFFATEESANAVAKMVNGKVERTTGGWEVTVEQRVPIRGLNEMTSVDELEQGVVRNLFGSANTTSKRGLNDLYRQAEASVGVIKRNIWLPYERFWTKVPVADERGVNKVVENILNVDTHRATWYTDAEFDSVYRSLNGGTAPTPVAKEAYQKLVDMDVASYRLQSDAIMKKKVEAGFTDAYTFANGPEAVAKRATNEYNASDMVWDYRKRTAVPVKDATDIFVLDEAMEIGDKWYRFVSGDIKAKRMIMHFDALDFKPGGPRIYKDARWFVKQEKEVNVAGRGKQPGTPRAILGARSQKEADAAVTEWNNVVRAVRGGASEATITRILQANNKWNPTLDTAADFIKYVEKNNLSYDDAARVFDNEPLSPQVSAMMSSGTDTWGTYFRARGSSRSARMDRPLPGYGEPALQTIDPTVAIKQRFSKATTALNEQAYMQRAMEGFFKGIEDLEKQGKNVVIKDNPSLVNNPFARLKEMEISTSSPAGRKFANERDTILRRAGTITKTQKIWQDTMGSVTEFVFDKTGKVLPKDIASSNPITALRSFAFFTRLGFFALPQIITQASQAAMATAISPKFGMQGLLLYPVIRMAMDNGQKGVIKELGSRASRGLGKLNVLDPEEFAEFITHYRGSGRYEVTHSIIELDGSNSMYLGSSRSQLGKDAANLWRKTKVTGRVPYEEGERVSRGVAEWIAFKEFKNNFPGDAISSPKAQEWISGRADTLTGNMTGASKRKYLQEGPLSIPAQFLSYQMSMTEQLFTNRILTKAERARVALAQIALYGGAGVPAASWVYNEVSSDSEGPVDPSVYALAHGGLVDFALSQLDDPVVFSKRLGIGQGFVDILDKIRDDQFMEVIGGPSGQLASDMIAPGINMLGDIIAGRPTVHTYDLEKAIRITAIGDSVFKAWYIERYGEYVARTGRVLSSGQDNSIAVTFGFKPLEADVGQRFSGEQADDRAMVKQLSDRTLELSRVMFRHIDDGDLTSADEVKENILMMILGANLSNSERNSLIRKAITPQLAEERVFRALLEDTRNGTARLYTQLLTGTE